MGDEFDPKFDDLDDGRLECPACGKPMTLDSDGDGIYTRDFWVCEECDGEPPTKARPPMRLEILIGMIASGKSTYARHRADKGALAVCHDDLTEMLHARYRYEADLRDFYRKAMHSIAHHAMYTGRDVVIDRTNLTREARAYWISFGREWKEDTGLGVVIEAVVFPRDSPQVHANRRTWMNSRGRTFKEWLKVAEHHTKQADAEPVTEAEGFDLYAEINPLDIARWSAEPNPFPAYLPPREAPDAGR